MPAKKPQRFSFKNLDLSKLKVLWYFLKPNKWAVFGLFLISAIIGAVESFNIVVLYHIFNYGLEVESGPESIFFRMFEWVNDLFPLDDRFLSACFVFIILALVVAVFRYLEIAYRYRLIEKILTKNRNRLFEKYTNADYQFFLDHKQGELIYNAFNAPERLTTVFVSVAILLSDVLLATQMFILLFGISFWGAIMIIVLGVIYFFLTRRIGSRKSYVLGRIRRDTRQVEQSLLNEFITGVRQMKVYHAEAPWEERYENLLAKDYRSMKFQRIWGQVPRIFMDLAMFGAVGFAAIILKIMMPYSFVSALPVFGSFGYAVFRLLPRFNSFGQKIVRIMDFLPEIETVHDLLEKKLDYIEDGTKRMTTLTHGPALDNVTFSYKEGSNVLEHVSMNFEKGKMTAIVGPSGTGKTTIINLVLRLFEPDSGRVTVNDTDLKQFELSTWLDKIGFVSQDPYLYNASIRDNIAFGREYADAAIVEAAKKAHAHEFARALPDGYETLVGDRGVKLSGGQMQRVAIARAIIRKPELVVLDEATSSLDSISERYVQEAINDISKGCTVIVIAHRLSTIINADMIYLIDEGTIVEHGTHEELVTKRGNYLKLYLAQQHISVAQEEP